MSGLGTLLVRRRATKEERVWMPWSEVVVLESRVRLGEYNVGWFVAEARSERGRSSVIRS